MYEKILIRYGELTLKGKNRDSFITQLARNIKVITGEYPEIKYDRMFLSYSEYNVKKLKYVFGITSYSPVIFCENNIEKITNNAIKLVDKENKTFKISARRNNKKFDFTKCRDKPKSWSDRIKVLPMS
nr:THUMP domain-containing protein [Mycoplasmopsis bovis]